MKKSISAAVLAVSLALGGCAANPTLQQYQYTATGAAIGGAAGALLGHNLEGRKGAYVGGAAGALLGGAVGNQMDRQRQSGYYGNNSGYYPPQTDPYYGNRQSSGSYATPYPYPANTNVYGRSY